ncbi:MAG: hypothetical protein K6A65_02755 [Succinivibrionaceae bacterium]|nr:hypothetical protein [Succinivibrionaceae bacterium]
MALLECAGQGRVRACLREARALEGRLTAAQRAAGLGGVAYSLTVVRYLEEALWAGFGSLNDSALTLDEGLVITPGDEELGAALEGLRAGALECGECYGTLPSACFNGQPLDAPGTLQRMRWERDLLALAGRIRAVCPGGRPLLVRVVGQRPGLPLLLLGVGGRWDGRGLGLPYDGDALRMERRVAQALRALCYASSPSEGPRSLLTMLQTQESDQTLSEVSIMSMTA